MFLPKLKVGRDHANFHLWQDSVKDAFQCQQYEAEYVGNKFPWANCLSCVWLPKIKVGMIPANFQLWQNPVKLLTSS